MHGVDKFERNHCVCKGYGGKICSLFCFKVGDVERSVA